MKCLEATPSRTLILRAERGDRLPRALEELAAAEGIEAAWVSGLGAVEWAEVAEYDQGARAYMPAQRVKGGAEILHLSGNLSMKDGEPMAHLHVTLSQERGERIRVLGGHLTDAELFAAELVVRVFDDVSLVRAFDEPTGLALWAVDGCAEDGPQEPVEEEPSVESGAGGWAAVAAASEQASRPRPRSTRRGDAGAPGIGDYLRHPKFGLCKIERRVSDDAVTIKLPSARRKTLKLSFLEVLEPRMEGERHVFPVKPRSKG